MRRRSDLHAVLRGRRTERAAVQQLRDPVSGRQHRMSRWTRLHHDRRWSWARLSPSEVIMSKEGFNNPFADALKDHPALEKKSDAPPTASGAKKVPAPARAVVRMERKGRGGKEVTVIE